jgi:hypothetical protein
MLRSACAVLCLTAAPALAQNATADGLAQDFEKRRGPSVAGFCFGYSEMRALLELDGQVQAWSGLTSPSSFMVVHANPATGEWALLEVDNAGKSCVRGHGMNSEVAK